MSKDGLKNPLRYPVIIVGTGLFSPTEELPIRSEPLVEQDVVALFNQMLSSGLVRGIQLISSSQFNQYDGLYRIHMDDPLERYLLSDTNPLGIVDDHFIGKDKLSSTVKILEYKYSIDGLIEEFQSEVKAVEDISLAVAWELGGKWEQMFEVISYLDEEYEHLRTIHGATHSFTHAQTGAHAFEAIVLEDLVSYLDDPAAEQERQRNKLVVE